MRRINNQKRIGRPVPSYNPPFANTGHRRPDHGIRV